MTNIAGLFVKTGHTMMPNYHIPCVHIGEDIIKGGWWMVTETIFFCIVSLASWAYGNTQSMWKGDSLGGPRPPPPGTRIPSRWFAHQLGVRFQTHTAVSLIWKLRLMPGNFDYDQNNCVICIKPSFANDGKAISGGQQSLGEGRIPR